MKLVGEFWFDVVLNVVADGENDGMRRESEGGCPTGFDRNRSKKFYRSKMVVLLYNKSGDRRKRRGSERNLHQIVDTEVLVAVRTLS